MNLFYLKNIISLALYKNMIFCMAQNEIYSTNNINRFIRILYYKQQTVARLMIL